MGFVEFDFDGQVDIRGAGEFVVGIGAMLVGISFGVSQRAAVFAVGIVALIGGGVVLFADTFGLDFGSRNAT